MFYCTDTNFRLIFCKLCLEKILSDKFSRAFLSEAAFCVDFFFHFTFYEKYEHFQLRRNVNKILYSK